MSADLKEEINLLLQTHLVTLDHVQAYFGWIFGDENSTLTKSADMIFKTIDPNKLGNVSLLNHEKIRNRQFRSDLNFILKTPPPSPPRPHPCARHTTEVYQRQSTLSIRSRRFSTQEVENISGISARKIPTSGKGLPLSRPTPNSLPTSSKTVRKRLDLAP